MPQTEIEYICIVQEREFVKSGEPVYRLARVENFENISVNPMRSFPQQSRIFLCMQVPKCKMIERSLHLKFRESVKHRTDLGAVYYEADVNRLINIVIMEYIAKTLDV